MKWVQAHESRDCGAACLATVALYYGRRLNVGTIATLAQTTRQGARLDKLRDAAHALGFAASCGKMREGALNALPLPAILHLHRDESDHYVVLLKLKRSDMMVADPTVGVIDLPSSEVLREFTGFVLLLKPEDQFGTVSGKYKGQHPWIVTCNIIRENGRSFALASAAGLVAASTSLAVPLFVGDLIDQSHYLNLSKNPLALTGALFVSVAIARSVFTLAKHLSLSALSVEVEKRYFSRFARRLPWLPLSFFDRCHPGDLVARVNDAVHLRLAMTGPILSLQTDVAYLVVSAVLLARMGSSLLLITLASILISFTLQGVVRGGEVVSLRIVRARMTELIGLLIEMVTGIRILKSLVKEREYLAKLQRKHSAALVALRRSNILSGFSASGSLLISGIGLAALIVRAQHLIVLHRLTAGQLAYLVTISSVTMGSSETISSALTIIEDVAVSVERLTQTERVQPEAEPARSCVIVNTGATKSLEFESVSFCYDGGDRVLDDACFSVDRGEVVGIKGESGSGKSTLAMLCNGLYRPTTGQIRVFGRPIEDWHLTSLRKLVCIVFSEGNLISGTVRNNIALDADVSDQCIEYAAKMAHAHGFIQSLPGGYSYRLGHMGVGLSSGQRQRLALARAFLLRPQILILDEATNNLDIDTEREVLRSLLETRIGLTTIVISHRRETLLNATTIFEMSNGRLSLADNVARMTS